MNMTISAVQLGTSSQPQVKTTESGFSDVLTEVRTASPQVQSPASQQAPEQPQSSGDEIRQAIVSEGVSLEAEITSEVFSAEFRETVVELVSGISDGSLEENNRIIDALLEILKKMGENDEEDTVMSLLAELLASMTGNTAFEFKASVSETAITSVNTEITAILSAESEPAENFYAAPQDIMPDYNAQQTSEAQPSAEIEQPAAFEQPITAEPTDISAAKPVDNAPEQPAVALSEQTAPADTYKGLLEDILAAARKDLGLTKAELAAAPSEAPVEESVQPQSEKISFTAPLNRKDGTDELKSILGEAIDSDTDSDTEVKAPAAQENSAALMGNQLPKQTEAITAEKPQAIEAPLPEQQISDEILSKPETVNGGRTEFTMELNPENLGKITVKLVSAEGRVQVNITAENDSTRALLENRAENIGAALRNNGVELEHYQVVSEREEAQLMQESYDGSSKNPYGRNDEEQQQNEDGDDFLEILQQL